MLEFVNGSNVALMSDKGLKINYSMNVQEMSTSFLVDIPSLNIHFYVENEKEIKKVANQTVSSFFDFWLKKNEFRAFIEQMFKLGFEIKSGNKVSKKTSSKSKKDIGRIMNNKLVINA